MTCLFRRSNPTVKLWESRFYFLLPPYILRHFNSSFKSLIILLQTLTLPQILKLTSLF